MKLMIIKYYFTSDIVKLSCCKFTEVKIWPFFSLKTLKMLICIFYNLYINQNFRVSYQHFALSKFLERYIVSFPFEGLRKILSSSMNLWEKSRWNYNKHPTKESQSITQLRMRGHSKNTWHFFSVFLETDPPCGILRHYLGIPPPLCDTTLFIF